MAAIRERGLRIPEDVAVVGFDDVPFARYATPPLTTAHLPAAELGRRAGEMLIELIGGRRPRESHVLLDTHLVVRGSCGAAGVRDRVVDRRLQPPEATPQPVKEVMSSAEYQATDRH
jgi:LacI family transcriptional regulator